MFDYSEYLMNLNEFEKKNAPKNLYVEGNASFLTEGMKVSVVGSRKPSVEGAKRTIIIAKELVKRNITVVSGLADGIDTYAHTAAIDNNGKTIAVLGTPLSKAYPAKNKALLERIKNNHLAISQFPENYPSQPKNFPMRNRTMALISDATIIIEASENSGTRHQGWEALRMGRLVFIMQNVAENPSITWAKEMISFGAQVLTRKNMDSYLENIPHLTGVVDFAY